MKTFSTSGTGSGQTLTEIENNKIPVYDTKTDAESDLANLTVGQIIATKDEGNETSTPVDVVQDGNMHAVTSNAVADSLSYSTSETLTGATWIDGKPIYRKVIVQDISGVLTGLVTIDPGVSNIETPIRVVCGRAEVSGSSNGITIPAQYDATTFIQLGTFRPDSLQLYAGSTNWTSLTHITVCIEYTKTTD